MRDASGVDDVPKVQNFVSEDLELGLLEFKASDAKMFSKLR